MAKDILILIDDSTFLSDTDNEFVLSFVESLISTLFENSVGLRIAVSPFRNDILFPFRDTVEQALADVRFEVPMDGTRPTLGEVSIDATRFINSNARGDAVKSLLLISSSPGVQADPVLIRMARNLFALQNVETLAIQLPDASMELLTDWTGDATNVLPMVPMNLELRLLAPVSSLLLTTCNEGKNNCCLAPIDSPCLSGRLCHR